MTELDLFAGQLYLNLETFRKNGAGVKTPVWFVQEGESLYIRTMAGSGKVKRINLNGRVNIAPCERDGAVTGAWIPARARNLTDEAAAQKVDRLLDEKYSELRKQLGMASTPASMTSTVLEVKLEPTL